MRSSPESGDSTLGMLVAGVRLQNVLKGMALPCALALVLGIAGAASTARAQDFEAILAAPDDAELNIAYARAQIQQGNLSIAASTLERVLINEPNRHSIRLLYAVVLYRLGDLQGAREELRRLDGVTLEPSQRDEANHYLRLVSQGLADSSYTGRLTMGLAYDNDAAGAYFTAFDIIGAPTPEEGVAEELALNIDLRSRLGESRIYDVYASGFLFEHAALSGAAVDVQRGDVEVGLARTTRLTTTRAGLVLRHVRVAGEPQLTETGLHLDTRWRATNGTALTFRAEILQQNYNEPLIDLLAPIIGGDRDGERYLVGLGVSHRLTARTSLGAGLDYEVKTAGYDPFAYTGPRAYASIDHRFKRGVYAQASASTRWVNYEDADIFFLAGKTREDVRSSARLAVGAPLSAFTARGATGDLRESLILEGALTYSRRDSVSPIADYEGWGAEIHLVWRFGARN